MMTTCGIILAAGMAQRFGSHKLLGDAGLLIKTHRALGAMPRVAGIRRDDDALADLCRRHGIPFTTVATAEPSLLATVQCALSSAPPATAYVILVADLKWICQAAIARAVAAWERWPNQVLVPIWAGAAGEGPAPGHPVIIPAAHRPAILQLPAVADQSGLRHWLRTLPTGSIQRWLVDDPAYFRDVDVPEDLDCRPPTEAGGGIARDRQ